MPASPSPAGQPALPARLDEAETLLTDLSTAGSSGTVHWRGLDYRFETSSIAEQFGVTVSADLGFLPYSAEGRSARDKAVQQFYALREQAVPGLSLTLTPVGKISFTSRTDLEKPADPRGLYSILATILLALETRLGGLILYLR